MADLIYRQRRRHYAIGGFLAAFSLLGLAAGVGWSAWAVLEGGLSAGQFAAMIVALRQVRLSVSHLVSNMSSLSVRPAQHRRPLHLPGPRPGRAAGGR